MKRLLVALVSVFVAKAACAAPVTYGFYQGGYAENAFVAGYFVADDINHNGFITHLTDVGTGPSHTCTLPPCELLDYFMQFSGNSLVRPFTHDGLSSFNLWDGADIDNLLGIVFDTRGSTIPVGNYLPPSCDGDCTSVPVGFMASQNVTFFNDGSIDRGVLWRGGLLSDSGWCGGITPLCGTISDQQAGSPTIGGFTTTNERIRIFAIPEPHALTLIGIALVGLAFIRRRAMRIG